jgi:hypothetical protein
VIWACSGSYKGSGQLKVVLVYGIEQGRSAVRLDCIDISAFADHFQRMTPISSVNYIRKITMPHGQSRADQDKKEKKFLPQE